MCNPLKMWYKNPNFRDLAGTLLLSSSISFSSFFHLFSSLSRGTPSNHKQISLFPAAPQAKGEAIFHFLHLFSFSLPSAFFLLEAERKCRPFFLPFEAEEMQRKKKKIKDNKMRCYAWLFLHFGWDMWAVVCLAFSAFWLQNVGLCVESCCPKRTALGTAFLAGM